MRSNEVIQGDCIAEMLRIDSESIDIVYTDPPFDIGYEYDAYEDNRGWENYRKWAMGWGAQILRVLKPSGTFWLAMGDNLASDLDVLFRRELGFHRRSWVVWFYTFGVNSKKKLTPSHTHLFHYVKNPTKFTFNGDAIKVPSARQMVYGDKRAKNGGRLPDDTWVVRGCASPPLTPAGFVLRPQDMPEGEQTDDSLWFIPRVCGTYKERCGWHNCQQPLAVVERVLKLSSNPGDIVLDPFAGSGTTLVAAKKLGRKYVGIELSENYVAGIRKRLEATTTPDSETLDSQEVP